jgi:MFS family permease
VVGSLVFARSVRRPLGLLLSAGTLAVGLAYVGFAVAPSLALACTAALIGGQGNGMQWASLISAVQQLTPQHLQGRMMGAVESLGALCPVLGLSLGGVLVAISSPRAAFLVVGLGATATTAPFLRIWASQRRPAPGGVRPALPEGSGSPVREPRPGEPGREPGEAPGSLTDQPAGARPPSGAPL